MKVSAIWGAARPQVGNPAVGLLDESQVGGSGQKFRAKVFRFAFSGSNRKSATAFHVTKLHVSSADGRKESDPSAGLELRRKSHQQRYPHSMFCLSRSNEAMTLVTSSRSIAFLDANSVFHSMRTVSASSTMNLATGSHSVLTVPYLRLGKKAMPG